MQLKLFNITYYDQKNNRYVIETTESKIIVYANDDGTVKKVQGMKHFWNKYETTSAKAMAQMIASDVGKNYVESNNLLPKIYDKKHEVIRYSEMLDKRHVQHWDLCVANMIRNGCYVTSTADPNIFSVVHDGRQYDELAYQRCKTFALVKT